MSARIVVKMLVIFGPCATRDNRGKQGRRGYTKDRGTSHTSDLILFVESEGFPGRGIDRVKWSDVERPRESLPQ